MKKLSRTTSFQFFAYSLGKIATVTGIQKTPRTRGTAMGQSTPLWNSTVATLDQRVRNGGGVKVFGVPYPCDTFSKILHFVFSRYCTHICTRQFYNKIESLKRHSMQLWEIQLPKDPHFRFFALLPKFGAK